MSRTVCRVTTQVTARLAILAGLFAALFPNIALSSSEQLLAQAYSQAWKDSARIRYEPPQQAELEATEELFVRLLEGQDPMLLQAIANKGGWILRSKRGAGRSVVVVSEIPTGRRGRGLYAFFDQGRHALQAPHVPSDKLTGEILLRYGNDTLPRALAWNTVPRNVADLAHLDGTDLIAFSRAFARVNPNEKILQLHGFDSKRRKTDAAEESAAIVSAGHSQPARELRDAVRCMKAKVDPASRLYGDDVQELGGTTNSVARALRAVGYRHFIHLELDLSLRERLLEDVKKRQALFNCLVGQS